MRPTLEEIKAVLSEYSEPSRSVWAGWLHENYHNESREVNKYLSAYYGADYTVRQIVFSGLLSRLVK